MMKNLIFFSLSIIFSCFFNRLSAQTLKPDLLNAEVSESITEMLDSLINIRTVSNYNNKLAYQSKNKIVSNEISSFSDEMLKLRMSKIQSPIPFTINAPVKAYINLYGMRRKELSGIMLGLSRLYFPIFEQVLDKYNLPLELKYLAMVESALNPTAVSKAGATGIWQFMYNTGRMYNLDVNSYVDERRDVYKATVAACEYFKDMYALYHDWLLVIASYNCGPRNVNKAIMRSGGKTNFWQIYPYLPRETQGYVPAFMGVTYVMKNAAEHNISAIPCQIIFHETDTVAITSPVMLDKLASTLDIPYDMVKFLNPVYKNNYVPASEGSRVRKISLPSNKIPAFLSNAKTIYELTPIEEEIVFIPNKEEVVNNGRKTNSSKATHVVHRGETLAGIAHKYHCTVADLKKWNKIGKKGKIVKGQHLKVMTNKSKVLYTSNEKPESTKVAKVEVSIATSNTNSDNKNVEINATQYIYHTVQQGDTLWNIAQRYTGVTVEKIKQLNQIISSKDLRPGTKIKIAVDSQG